MNTKKINRFDLLDFGEENLLDKLLITASNDEKDEKLYYEGYEPLCPECGRRAFPTDFPPQSVGGEKSDKRRVWFCSDMGHCAFPITKSINWQKKVIYDKNIRK